MPIIAWQAVVDEYSKCGKQFQRLKLTWRSRKRSLGWLPFKAVGVKVGTDSVTYGGQTFRFFGSRPLPGKVRFGSWARGRARQVVRELRVRRPHP